MSVLKKIISIKSSDEVADEKIAHELKNVQSEYDKVRKIIDLFMLAMLLIFVMYITS